LLHLQHNWSVLRLPLLQSLQVSVFLRNPFVQILPLKVGDLGRKEPAIALNVSPMVPHLGRMKINHPP
jgi:hypothetical protein